jgi:hypothetical protein
VSFVIGGQIVDDIFYLHFSLLDPDPDPKTPY